MRSKRTAKESERTLVCKKQIGAGNDLKRGETEVPEAHFMWMGQVVGRCPEGISKGGCRIRRVANLQDKKTIRTKEET